MTKFFALVVASGDNVATVFSNGVNPGCVISVSYPSGDVKDMSVRDSIPYGHKFALRNIAFGESVIKYSEIIGTACSYIECGSHVHVHNINSNRGRGDIIPNKDQL